MPESKKRQQFLETTFPLRGIDQSQGFSIQPQDTTAVGQNVRTFEALTKRSRGGQRPGLNRYINAQVSGSALIQHLNTVVEHDSDALITFTDPAVPSSEGGGGGGGMGGGGAGTPAAVEDPSTNNNEGGRGPRSPGGRTRLIRQGGSGVQPNRNVGVTKTPASMISYVQSRSVDKPISTAQQTLAYTANVVSGNLLIAIVGTNCIAFETVTSSVDDTQGNTWTLVKHIHGTTEFSTNAVGISLFYAIAGASGANTVRWTPSAIARTQAIILEYSGAHASPLEGSASNRVETFTSDWTSTNVTISGAGRLLVGVFNRYIAGATLSGPGTGFTLRHSQDSDIFNTTTYMEDKLEVGATAPATAVSIGSGRYLAIGASFKPA